MADVRPMSALRPPAALAARVSAPPYDVMDVEEARTLAAGNPDSFLHVSRPEIDLPPDVDPYDAQVYRQGRRALEEFVARGVLVRDTAPGYLVYRQTWNGACQTGVVGCAAVADYESGLIRTHEHTRPDKENDRVRHVDALAAHDEPVFLLTPPSADLGKLIAEVTAEPPEYDFTTGDGVGHVLWPVSRPDRVDALREALTALPTLYVADGHHRSAAAVTVHGLRRQRRAESGADSGAGEDAAFLAVVFPSDELRILPYNRVVADLAGHTPATLLDALADRFEVTPAAGAVEPDRRHDFGLYLAGQWYRLSARPGLVDETGPISRLDVTVLQEQVLAPLLGIGDPRTDTRIRFVGGIRGTAELERLVDAGSAAVAFSLYPTSVDELLAVADAGTVMPPKSTWFEPKLRSGLFVHPLD
ncbi:MAG TPA: DUF1015 family protein [Kineosporiaceae bacterium]|nr:DUF1015 family protein [Kineosporiaceae bacterium]